jgi:hypothetical protein
MGHTKSHFEHGTPAEIQNLWRRGLALMEEREVLILIQMRGPMMYKVAMMIYHLLVKNYPNKSSAWASREARRLCEITESEMEEAWTCWCASADPEFLAADPEMFDGWPDDSVEEAEAREHLPRLWQELQGRKLNA